MSSKCSASSPTSNSSRFSTSARCVALISAMRPFAEMDASSKTRTYLFKCCVWYKTVQPKPVWNLRMKGVYKPSVSLKKTSASSRTIASSMARSWAHPRHIILSTKMCSTFSSGLRPGSKWSFTASLTQRQRMRSATSSKTISLTMETPFPSHPS